MGTTVEAKTPDQAAAPVTARPWYRDYQRVMMIGLILAVAVAVVGWFVFASGKPESGTRGCRGREPAASLERAAEAYHDL
jgi:hypothetical protein